eukprot:5237622-Prymnesium_polylepis.2
MAHVGVAQGVSGSAVLENSLVTTGDHQLEVIVRTATKRDADRSPNVLPALITRTLNSSACMLTSSRASSRSHSTRRRSAAPPSARTSRTPTPTPWSQGQKRGTRRPTRWQASEFRQPRPCPAAVAALACAVASTPRAWAPVRPAA